MLQVFRFFPVVVCAVPLFSDLFFLAQSSDGLGCLHATFVRSLDFTARRPASSCLF
jgi:hypothetical protein